MAGRLRVAQREIPHSRALARLRAVLPLLGPIELTDRYFGAVLSGCMKDQATGRLLPRSDAEPMSLLSRRSGWLRLLLRAVFRWRTRSRPSRVPWRLTALMKSRPWRRPMAKMTQARLVSRPPSRRLAWPRAPRKFSLSPAWLVPWNPATPRRLRRRTGGIGRECGGAAALPRDASRLTHRHPLMDFARSFICWRFGRRHECHARAVAASWPNAATGVKAYRLRPSSSSWHISGNKWP